MDAHTRDRQLDRLPSLPQVLLRILDAITEDPADFSRLARIIRQDAAVSARLITIANSSYYRRQHSCETVEAALSYLGVEAVRTLVITAAVKQYFAHFNHQHRQFMRHFWFRSLVSANCAQALASLTSYHSPAEAYLGGLLTDVGQLWLLTAHDLTYPQLVSESAGDDGKLLELEQQRLGATHQEAGADLLADWHMDNFMAEAVRYHHHPFDDIRYGHHLVKIINLASELSAATEPSEQGLQKAADLFGLNNELVIEVRRRVQSDVHAIADDLGIAIESPQAEKSDSEALQLLGDRLGEISQHQALCIPAPSTRNQSVGRALYLGLGIERHLLFTLEASGLSARTAEAGSDFVIGLDSDSAVAQCHTTGETVVARSNTTSIVDRQLISYCRKPFLLCLPVRSDGVNGVLVAGADEGLLRQQHEKTRYWQALINDIAQLPAALAAEKQPQVDDRRIREAIHEVSNPLSIINNYLEMLRMRFGEDEAAAGDLLILREEIDRVGKILLRLKDPQQPTEESQTDVPRVLRELVRVFEQSLCLTRGIRTELQCDTSLPLLRSDTGVLKQILTNLFKNAVEAMPDGGLLSVLCRSTRTNGRSFVDITIRDSGPGIGPGQLDTLFDPGHSTKGAGHAGLGLSIVKSLMDSLDAQILCSSDKDGTEFRLLFPMENV